MPHQACKEATRRGSASDVSIMGLTQIGVAVPNFWFAMLLVLFFVGAGRYVSLDYWLARRFRGGVSG